jgi:hypothetical protein
VIEDIIDALCENDDVRRERAAFVARLRKKHHLGFRQIGKHLNVSKQRAHQLYGLHHALKEAEAALTTGEAQETVNRFLNQSGFRGQFKVWPRGYQSEGVADYEFTVTMSDFMRDAWQSNWSARQELDLLAQQLGYDYDMDSSLHFYKLPR